MNWPTLDGVPVALGQELTAAEVRKVREGWPNAWLAWRRDSTEPWSTPEHARFHPMPFGSHRFHGMGDQPRDLDNLAACIRVGDVVDGATAKDWPGEWRLWVRRAGWWPEVFALPDGTGTRYRYDGPAKPAVSEEVTREVVAWLEGHLWLPEDTPTRAGWNDALRAAARDARRGECPALPAISPRRDPVTNLTAEELREACRRMGLEVSDGEA